MILDSDKVSPNPKDLQVQVYKDVLKPSAQSLGEILSFLPRTIRLFLSGWEKWLINGEETLKVTAAAIKEKVSQIPADKIVEPEPYVVVPAIQQLSYCQDNKVLCELYANLLVSSMNADTKWNVHPAFLDILKQINPDEAKILMLLKKDMTYPLIDIRLNAPTVGYHDIVVNYTSVGHSAIDRKRQVSECIDNLSRLGIIRISDSFIIDDSRYDESIRLSEQLFHVPENTTDGWTREYKKHLFELTYFGASFVATVVQPAYISKYEE